jgi:hypothetical protein
MAENRLDMSDVEIEMGSDESSPLSRTVSFSTGVRNGNPQHWKAKITFADDKQVLMQACKYVTWGLQQKIGKGKITNPSVLIECNGLGQVGVKTFEQQFMELTPEQQLAEIARLQAMHAAKNGKK